MKRITTSRLMIGLMTGLLSYAASGDQPTLKVKPAGAAALKNTAPATLGGTAADLNKFQSAPNAAVGGAAGQANLGAGAQQGQANQPLQQPPGLGNLGTGADAAQQARGARSALEAGQMGQMNQIRPAMPGLPGGFPKAGSGQGGTGTGGGFGLGSPGMQNPESGLGGFGAGQDSQGTAGNRSSGPVRIDRESTDRAQREGRGPIRIDRESTGRTRAEGRGPQLIAPGTAGDNKPPAESNPANDNKGSAPSNDNTGSGTSNDNKGSGTSNDNTAGGNSNDNTGRSNENSGAKPPKEDVGKGDKSTMPREDGLGQNAGAQPGFTGRAIGPGGRENGEGGAGSSNSMIRPGGLDSNPATDVTRGQSTPTDVGRSRTTPGGRPGQEGILDGL